jgi:hypothetical protein
MPLSRIATAEPVIHGVLKLVFAGGYEGVVDLRPIIAQGRIFKWKTFPKFNSKKTATMSIACLSGFYPHPQDVGCFQAPE